jgi:GNAT superfamily N-acetyltransferase
MLESLDRKLAFRIVKEVDDLPRVNASAALMFNRVIRFLGQMPQRYYEPIRDLEDLYRQMRDMEYLRSISVPEHACHHFQLVFETFDSAYGASSGVIEFPRSGDKSLGLHAVIPEVLQTDGAIRFWNSWGSSWGDHGYGVVRRDYLDRYFSSSNVRWNALWGTHPRKWALENLFADDSRPVKRAWMIENPRFKGQIRAATRDVWVWESFNTVSELEQAGASVFAIRTGYGLRMGWAHVVHLTEQPKSRILELFVMPAFRGQGIGSCLEGMCTEDALSAESAEIELVLNEVDAVVGGPLNSRKLARNFGDQRGYTWRWRRDRTLGVEAVGFKRVTEAAIRGR